MGALLKWTAASKFVSLICETYRAHMLYVQKYFSDVHHTVYMLTSTCTWLTLLSIYTKDKAAWFLPRCCSQAGLKTYLSTNWLIRGNLISSCAVLSPQGLSTVIIGTVYVSGFVDKWAGRTTGGPLGVRCHIWYHMTDLAVLIDRNSYSVMQRSCWSMRCGMGILHFGQIINGL